MGKIIKGQLGINIYKNFKLNLIKPIKNIDVQIVQDNQKINIKWLVKAIPKGIKLIKFENKIKLKIQKINGNQNKP